jgi:superfamily II DNA or RNA helicase
MQLSGQNLQMALIKVIKKDEVHIKVDTDPSTAQEICDFFTFDVPGARFMPLYRKKVWDGKARLFNVYNRELYIGLLPYLKEFAETLEYDIEVNMPNIGEEIDIERFTNELRLQANGKDIEIRDYQKEAVTQAITTGRTLLLSPTASGKSLIIYSLIRYHQLKGRKQLIIVPTTSLVEQMYGDFQDYSSANKAKSLTTLMNKLVSTPYRVGTTGTLDGTKTHRLVLEGVFGQVHKVTTTKKLMDNKQLANLKIVCCMINWKDAHRKEVKGMTYQEEIDWIVTHPDRNEIIKNLTIAQEGNTLVLFQYVEKHGVVLHEMISKAVKANRKVFFVYGGTDTEVREEIRAITEKQDDAIIIASYGTFSTGIGDDLSWKSKKNYTMNHLIERIKIYNEEGFNYKLVKLDV